jgi:cytoskeleton protein RodZ
MIPVADLRFGEELRRERLAREVTLEEISSATKISLRVLRALEASDLARLPAPAFTRGFIRSYAQHIGIDAEEKVCAYLADMARHSDGKAPLAVPGRRKFWRSRRATAGIIVGGVTAVLLLMGLIARPDRHAIARPEKPAPKRVSKVELKNVAVSSEPTPAVRQPEAAALAAAAPSAAAPSANAALTASEEQGRVSLVLEFDQDSWTKLDADGETLFRGLIRRGETRRFEARGELRITLGNAGAVRVTVNGHAIDSLGKAGQVVRDLPIPVPAARG